MADQLGIDTLSLLGPVRISPGPGSLLALSQFQLCTQLASQFLFCIQRSQSLREKSTLWLGWPSHRDKVVRATVNSREDDDPRRAIPAKDRKKSVLLGVANRGTTTHLCSTSSGSDVHLTVTHPPLQTQQSGCPLFGIHLLESLLAAVGRNAS